MKFLTYVNKDKKEQVGILDCTENYVYSIIEVNLCYQDMNELIMGLSEEEKISLQNLQKKLPEEVKNKNKIEEIYLKAPIPHPNQDIICLGINYMAHAEESARFKKEEFSGERPYAVYFSKRVTEAVASGECIMAHEDLVDSLDYECEMAVILGKDAKNVSREEAKEYIFGYTIINDVSARTIQNRHKQWYFGKSLDGFTPMGPWIVSKEEIEFPPKLSICSKVNGEIRQDSNTELLIFDIAHVIQELSQGMTLKAGTIISMGTPAGVGMGFQPPKFLKAGDRVECIVEKIGTLVNTVK